MKHWLVVAALVLGLSGGLQAQVMPMDGTDHKAHAAAKPSTTLTVTMDGKATVLTVAELAAMPQTTVTAKNGHTGVVETYSGVAVGDVLAKLGFTFENATAKRTYHSYIKAEGTDGYWVLFSASELTPTLRETGSVIALELDGKPLGEDGAIRIVVAGEKRPARWVRNLKALTVVTVD